VGAKKSGSPIRPVAVAAVVLVLAAVPIALAPPFSLAVGLARFAALAGYQLLFLAIISSALLRQMLRWFGRPFLRVHHWSVVTGLALLATHPVFVSIGFATARYLLPQFGSPRLFLAYGGAPAIYVFILGTLVAVFRKALGPRWKRLHWLVYLAFLLASVHAMLIGDSFGALPALRVVPAAAAVAVVAIFARRQRQAKRAPKPMAAGLAR
jgi:methionine sulfoxide reductase heme-binding subunit